MVDNESGSLDELWMVQAVIQPFKLDAVTRALETVAGFTGMTVTNVRGFGQERLEDLAARSAARGRPRETLDDFTSKVRLDIAVTGQGRANDVADVIARSAHTGNRGDGKIFLWPLARVIRVRTMEEDSHAL